VMGRFDMGVLCHGSLPYLLIRLVVIRS